MNRIIIGLTALSLTALAHAPGLNAQDAGRWGLEFRASGSIATQDAARDTHENGIGFEATVQYRLLEHLSAYAGWDWTHYQALEAIAGPDMDLEETGYLFGLRFEHSIRQGRPLAYWVRSAATVKHLELENDEGDIVDDSGHGLGWEVGAGLAVPFATGWSATPGIHYRTLSRDLDVGTQTFPVELQSVSLEIGIARRF